MSKKNDENKRTCRKEYYKNGLKIFKCQRWKAGVETRTTTTNEEQLIIMN